MASTAAIEQHLAALSACRRCPRMLKPVVTGRPVRSRVLLVGQAPGDKEPKLGRPFAWTAGKTLFKWFNSALGWTEDEVRDRLYFSAVCRCFPGKRPEGGDRVPAPDEIANCSGWLEREFALLQPQLVLPVGKLAIGQFLGERPLIETIGRSFTITYRGHLTDCIPLPHPSGASPWHRMEPGKTLLHQALSLVAVHPAITAEAASSKRGVRGASDESGTRAGTAESGVTGANDTNGRALAQNQKTVRVTAPPSSRDSSAPSVSTSDSATGANFAEKASKGSSRAPSPSKRDERGERGSSASADAVWRKPIAASRLRSRH